MKYLVSYPVGIFGLKSELEVNDNLYAEVPDDFMFKSGKEYRVFSDGTYEVSDKKVERFLKDETDVELG